MNEAHLRYDDSHAEWAAGRLDLTEEELAVTLRTMERVIGLYSQHYLDSGVCVGRRDEPSGQRCTGPGGRKIGCLR